MTSKEQQIADMLEGTVSALGFELWGVEYLAQGRHSIVRIYIDSPRGVSVDDCALVSAQVGGVLDVDARLLLEGGDGVDEALLLLTSEVAEDGHDAVALLGLGVGTEAAGPRTRVGVLQAGGESECSGHRRRRHQAALQA